MGAGAEAILALIAVAIALFLEFCFRHQRKIKAKSEESALNIKAVSSCYLARGSIDNIPDISHQIHTYNAVKGERPLAWARLADLDGRLILTDKALVVETDFRNERITLGSISKIEIYSDGILVRKRNGGPKQYKIHENPDFLALADTILRLR